MEYEDFEKILESTIKEFGKINKIGFIGIMGSRKIKRDLDIVIIPNKKVKKGEFLKTLCNFLEILRTNLKKENSNLVAFTHSYFQEEVENLSKRNKKQDIFLHIISFVDLVPKNKEVIKAILKTNKIYYGDKKTLELIPKTNIDYYYNYLFFINCLYSNYSKELETEKIHERISYIFKYNNSKITLKNKTNKQIYFECCDFLDSISKEI